MALGQVPEQINDPIDIQPRQLFGRGGANAIQQRRCRLQIVGAAVILGGFLLAANAGPRHIRGLRLIVDHRWPIRHSLRDRPGLAGRRGHGGDYGVPWCLLLVRCFFNPTGNRAAINLFGEDIIEQFVVILHLAGKGHAQLFDHPGATAPGDRFVLGHQRQHRGHLLFRHPFGACINRPAFAHCLQATDDGAITPALFFF